MKSRAPTLHAHNDPLLTGALIALPGAGMRLYGGMYVDDGLKYRWTVENIQEHYRIAADAREVLEEEGTPVAIVLRFDSGNFYQAEDFGEVYIAWRMYGNIKMLYLIDWEFWIYRLSYGIPLIKKGP